MNALFNTEPLDQFKNASQEILDNLFVSNERARAFIEQSVADSTKQEIIQLITDCNFDIDEVAASFNKRSWNQYKVDYFVTILQEKRVDLLYSLLASKNSEHGETLINFNWVLKLVLGTSELKSLRYPLMQLVLNTKSANDKERQRMYELNKEALGKLICVMEGTQLTNFSSN